MPSTFFIEDILRSEPTRPRCMQSNANYKANQLFSPINLQQKIPNSKTANLPISYHDVELSRMCDNSSIDEYNLNIQNISSSTSPSSRSDSSTGSQQCVQPDPILNQFYSRLLYLNYQKICQDATAPAPNNQLFANIYQDQQQSNNHQAYSVNAKKAFKKFESRKSIHDADDLNVDDQQSSCSSSSTNTDCNSSGVSPLDALFNMATTTFVIKPSPGIEVFYFAWLRAQQEACFRSSEAGFKRKVSFSLVIQQVKPKQSINAISNFSSNKYILRNFQR
jgi:hypothetical protein